MANHFPEIPELFWGLFRSGNRMAYIEALLRINEEYQYSNYYLSREICVQALTDCFAKQKVTLEQEETEDDFDLLEPLSTRILNWLLRTGWLKKVEDYGTMAVNIVIPDYSAVFIDAFERLDSDEMEETDIYIQNVYATLFSFRNDPRGNLGMLRTALVNTRRLNKALQDMLHNMDKFFARLLEQETYGELLKEHLNGYVEAVVRRKYHILKTSDNFYIYKMDIKKCLREMREDEGWIENVQKTARMMGDMSDDIYELLDLIERGFDDIEHRISNMDKEHTKYVRATVTRLNYLLSGQSDTKGLVVQLLNRIAASEDPDGMLCKTAEKLNLSLVEMLSEKPLYKRRRSRKDFMGRVAEDEETKELNKEDVLRLNRIQVRYSKEQIEEFIESHMKDEIMDAAAIDIADEEEFEKLILAYDYSTRKSSRYMLLEEEPEQIENNGYRYPALKFVRRRA